MHWVAHAVAHGPLRFMLMHVTVDPLGVLTGAAGGRAHARVRCVLRSGIVYAAGLRGPRAALGGACRVLAAALPQHGYHERAFPVLERDIGAALRAAGFGAVSASLERNAALRARPALGTAQVDRLIAAAVARHAAHGAPDARRAPATSSPNPPAKLPDPMSDPMSVYLAALDGAARDYVEAGRPVHGQGVDRLAVYNFIVGHEGRSRYRVQALRALPWLLPLLAAPQPARSAREAAMICAAIDGAEPLHDAVARAFDVPREVVRWLGKRALPGHWRLDEVRLRRLLAALSWLPPERRPRTPAQFAELVQLCGVLAGIFRFRDDRGDLQMRAWSALHGTCMRRWLAECGRPGWARDALARDPQRFAAQCADAADFLGTLADAVQCARDAGGDAALASVVRWAGGIGLRRLLAMSVCWHAQAFGADDAPADAAGPAGPSDAAHWPAILP